MNWNQKIRQLHRWVSIAFTLAVIVNIVALATMGQDQSEPAVWIGMLALCPLIVLLLTGLYLFAQPYLSRSRGSSTSQG